MKKSHSLFLLITIVSTVLLLVASAAVRGRLNVKQAGVVGQVVQPVGVLVGIAKITRHVVSHRAALHGFLEPFLKVTIAGQVPGEIVEQHVDVSDAVDAGQTLFKIDDGVRETERQQAAAALERASSELELAEANWHRMLALPEPTSSSMERIEGETQYRAAKADKQRAEAALRKASLLLDRTQVRSPIDGVVSRVHARRGEYSRQGQPLADVIDVARLKLFAEIESRDVVWVRVGQRADLSTMALPGEHFHGAVHRIHPLALPTSRKFQVEIELANANRRLRPGFFMNGSIVGTADGPDVSDAAGILLVPREAVVEVFGQDFCYVVRRDEAAKSGDAALRALRKPVEVWPIPSDPQHLRLVRGASEGDLVVTKGLSHLTDQAIVRITD